MQPKTDKAGIGIASNVVCNQPLNDRRIFMKAKDVLSRVDGKVVTGISIDLDEETTVFLVIGAGGNVSWQYKNSQESKESVNSLQRIKVKISAFANKVHRANKRNGLEMSGSYIVDTLRGWLK